MEVRSDDGRVQMRRCLDEMDRTHDIETRISLWRAARKYSKRMSNPERGETLHTLGVSRIEGLGSP